jgi:uncharacterized DUF497 family protein
LRFPVETEFDSATGLSAQQSLTVWFAATGFADARLCNKNHLTTRLPAFHAAQLIHQGIYICIYRSYNKCMQIEFDTDKRDKTLLERGLDFARAAEIFSSPTLNLADNRANYGETRNITIGLLDGRLVVLVWTPRGAARRIISLRKANEREVAHYTHRLD